MMWTEACSSWRGIQVMLRLMKTCNRYAAFHHCPQQLQEGMAACLSQQLALG